jgi:hypothetical protein
MAVLARRRGIPVSSPPMLTVGDRIPDAKVWLGPQEPISLFDVIENAPALFLFYLFDWSST